MLRKISNAASLKRTRCRCKNFSVCRFSNANFLNSNAEKKKKAFERMKVQLEKLELQATDREENKEIALGTSKLNYLDPRISVAWYDFKQRALKC
jgi:tRNA/tmRNA/rRNA uracil-C5-methylase (TrmA/RlmC/RlmD family)